MKVLLIFTFILLIIVTYGHARIINVPSEIDSIQGGINLAEEGDTVLVQPGRYHECIDFNGKNIVVGSLVLITRDTSYVSRTVIDGDSSGSVATFMNGEDSTAFLIGFSITNGRNWAGGGIFCQDASPTLKVLKVYGNHTIGPFHQSAVGHGIYLSNSNSSLEQVIITKNNDASPIKSMFSGGGGICLTASSIKMKDVIISENVSDYGGGIFMNSSTLYLDHVLITENSASIGGPLGSGGGGIRCTRSCLNLKAVSITHNSGGGIYIDEDCKVNFDSEQRCNIYLNTALSGEDLFCSDSTIIAVIVDTFTVATPTEKYAYPIEKFTFDILNAKVEQVRADLYVNPAGDDNHSGLAPDAPLRTITRALTKILADSLNPRSIYLSDGIYSFVTNGEFFPLDIPSYVSLIGASEDGVIFEHEGGFSVMGFYRNKGNTIKNISIMGSYIYSTDSNPIFRNLKLYNSNYGFTFSNSTAIFENTMIDNCSSAGISCHDSDIKLKNVSICNNQDSGIYLDEGSSLLGMNVLINTNNAQGAGGGLVCYESQVFLDSSIVSNNSAQLEGGGISCSDGSQLDLNGTIITGNQARAGGGIYCSGRSQINLEDVIINDNTSVNCGGGICCIENDTLIMDKTTITANSCGEHGAGIYAITAISLNGTNLTIDRNVAKLSGGGIWSGYYSNFHLTNVLISNNTARQYGGGIYSRFYSAYDLTHVTIGNNTGNKKGGGIYSETGSNFSFSDSLRCNIYHNTSSVGSDLFKSGLDTMAVVVDTFSVLIPTEGQAYPIAKFTFDILNAKSPSFINDAPLLPKKFALYQNHPNPFNPSTKIKFSLPKPETVKIEVYNIIGQKIQTLLNKPMAAGYHEVEFKGHNLSSGIYLYKIEAGKWNDARKMVLLR